MLDLATDFVPNSLDSGMSSSNKHLSPWQEHDESDSVDALSHCESQLLTLRQLADPRQQVAEEGAPQAPNSLKSVAGRGS